MQRPYIVYSLSKDRTTQKFNKSKFQDILQDIEVFLQNCTTTNISEPDTIELTAYTDYDATEPTAALTEIIRKTSKRFGASEKRPIAFHYPSGEADSTSRYKWTFTKDRLQEIVQYIIDNSPMPKANFGPLELYFTYSFKLLDTTTKEELPNQEHTASFCIWFSTGKSCSPTIFFPFEHADIRFWNYVDSIIPYLPFKLEEKYFRIAHVNRQGQVTSFKKIQRHPTT